MKTEYNCLVNVAEFLLGQSVTTKMYDNAPPREGTVTAIYSTWFAGCLTAAAKPATHINYIVQMRDGSGFANGAGHFFKSVY